MITKLHLKGCITGHLFTLKVTPGANRLSKLSRFSDTGTLKCYVLNQVEVAVVNKWPFAESLKYLVMLFNFVALLALPQNVKIQLLHNLHYVTVLVKGEVVVLLASLSKFLP